MIWNRAAETVDREELEVLQLDRLRVEIARCAERVPLYRRTLLPHVGEGITLETLAHLPFTTKSDLRDAYPFGMLAVPREELVRIHASSGTKGKPTVVGYTRADIDIWSELCARALAAAGATRGDVVHNAYGYGLFTGGLGIHYGAERLGCTVVPASGGDTPRQVQLITDFQARVLCCTPSYALHVADTMTDMGIDPLSQPLSTGVFGAEPWSDGLRAEIERRLGIRALDIYGLSELIGPGVASECTEQAGAHISEDHFLVEVIDPGTGERLPDGVEGELVFSTLTKEALPLVRYRTGDLASVDREPCACGRTFARMSRVKGRTDDMLIVRGVNLFPSEVESALLHVTGIAPHYQLRLERPGPLDVLIVDVEPASTEVDREALARAARYRIEVSLGLSCEVRVLDPGGVPRSQGKALRVIDARQI